MRQDGLALQYVREQNEEICLSAVQQNPDAQRYVKRFPLIEEGNGECCVCYDECKTITPCNHRICKVCFDKLDNKKCPYCRMRIN